MLVVGITFCFLLCASNLIQVRGNGCSITLPTDMPTFEPVHLLSSDGIVDYQLFKPTGQVTILPVGAKLLLACTGSKNVINSLNTATVELHCTANNNFATADNTVHQLNEMGCKSIPSSSLQITQNRCANNQGYVYEAGFVFNTNKFVKTFTVCYDNVTEHTFYTHNILNGAAINYNIQESTRRAFSAEGMKLTTTATNTYYTINNQISRFETYFGSSQSYVSSSMFLARGHLTPDADFIFSYEQLSTYYYVNAAPEFQIVNAGNWLRVENLARTLAGQYGRDLQIWNGYIGELQLPDAALNPITIYLDSAQKIEAVKYYYKVIQDTTTDAAIVFITLNNPFATSADIDEFCTNVCDRAGLNSANYADLTRGYTFCCELNDFKQHVVDLPASVTATYLFNEPIA